MKKSQILKAGTASFALSLALVSAPAFAQDTTDAAAQPAAAEATVATDDPIVVTGSLIRNPNLERSNPVNVTTADDLELLQTNVAEEVLREIPGIVPSIGSAVNNGNGGSSFVNLRGLGSNRNLVLLDGQRIVPADLAGQVDLNNIPLALVERMDVLTGGSSTTYGADAVTGVVNFVTKRDFAGVEATAGYQITDRGDGAVFRADLTTGVNFDDGRGNLVLGLGYQQADHVTQGDREISVNNIDSFSGGSGGSGTTYPTRVSIDGVPYQTSPDGKTLVRYYQPYNFNPSNIFQTPFKRYNMFASGHYEVADGIEVYSRGMFSKNTIDTEIASSGAFGIPIDIPSTNPYLTDQMKTLLCGSATTPCTKTVALFRRAVEAGPRVSSYNTTIFDYRAGVRGKVTSTIDFDVSASYGQSENIQTIKGYTSDTRWQTGISCAPTDTSCTVVDPFGILTPDMVDYLTVESNSFVKTSLFQTRGMLSGDFGWQLPSASNPIAFAAGAEYRKYTAAQGADTLASSGDLGGAGGATPPIKGAFNVYEFIGEIVVPLIQDKPFFEDLTVEAGIRNSHYSIDAPGNPKFSTTTWKAGGSWTPGAGFKIRGNYARAVRAPNIGELFSPPNTGLTNLNYDPCATRDDNGDLMPGVPAPTGALRDVCLAQGATAAHLAAGIAVPTAGQANATFSGSPNLKPETSNSWTVGFVWQPDFVRGFNMSIDYYNIKVKNAITAPTPDDVMNACFGTGNLSATNPACTAIRRDPLTGQLSGDEGETPGLPAPTTNSGYLETDGVDFSLNYTHNLDFAKLGLGVQGNWTNHSRFRSIPTGLLRDCVGYYSVNCASIQPEWSWTTRATLGFDGIDVSLLWRHISGVQYEPNEYDKALDGNPLSGSGPAHEGPAFGMNGNYNFNKIKAYDWFDLTTRFDVTENLGITLTVQNLFDKKPPLVGSSIGTTTYNSGNTYPSTYDAIGRRYGVQAKLKF